MRTLKARLEKNIENVYRITGDDAFLMQKAVDMIKSACGETFAELNQSFFDNENFNADAVINSCFQLPIGLDKRFVLVKNIKKISEADKNKLAKYCANPCPDSVLVLYDTDNIFKNVKAENVECKHLSDSELSSFIKERLDIEPDAIKLFIDYCSHDLTRISKECEKLALLKEKITTSVIEKMVAKSEEYSIFEITTALSKRDGDESLRLLKTMLETSDVSVILALISNHFRRLFYSVTSPLSPAEISKELGCKEYAIIKAKEQAKNFKQVGLKKILELCLETEYLIKIGKMSAENGIYYLIINILETK